MVKTNLLKVAILVHLKLNLIYYSCSKFETYIGNDCRINSQNYVFKSFKINNFICLLDIKLARSCGLGLGKENELKNKTKSK